VKKAKKTPEVYARAGILRIYFEINLDFKNLNENLY
jgi:hypothetical protein